jgi:hypothetical protein
MHWISVTKIDLIILNVKLKITFKIYMNEDSLSSSIEKSKRSTQTLKDSLQLARDSVDVGRHTLNELQTQKEQLNRIHDQIDNINSNIGASNNIIRKLNVKWYDPRGWI